MTERIQIKEIEPESWKAMMALENYIQHTTVDPKLKELLKIRASHVNSCTYCIDMHTEYALKLGETEKRIAALAVWKESHLFSEAERIALQLTDEITLISVQGVTNETYNNAVSCFGEKGTAQLIMLAVLINSWNRIATTTKMIYK